MTAMNKNEEILEELARLYPDAKPALHFRSPYELLVAVVLSAQCTDERVNKVTAVLFKDHDTPQKMLTLSQEELERYIFSCGFYRNKAKHILSASRDIISRYDGQVPDTLKDLQTLAGVGRKTANVVYAVAFGGDAIAVDTHVFRVSHRLGLSNGKTPDDVEKDLCARFEPEDYRDAHFLLIRHGRACCHARNPECGECVLGEVCPSAYTYDGANVSRT